ncbi:MFS transporter [Mycobacterium sp. NPDC050853]|uniref:MFS transporter n=1 Tax=Mycobacterium sp. NPDC050853 TaxID=3155160 RepID=UPI0033F82C8F
MGNATEWYDYGVYAATTTFLTQAFFPTLGTAFTMLGYAISFLLRPLGGMIWGPLGDKLGRKSVMVITIVLMALSTTLIGVLPSWATIGAAAPALLILLRVIQGFSTGGEYGGAATFMAEFAPDKKRGKYGSFLEFGTLGGFATGAAFVLVLDATLGAEAMHSWGWRIPFLLALPMGLIGWYLRSRLDDPPLFVEVQRQEQQGGEGVATAFERLKDLVREYKRPMIVMMLLVIALNITNYTLLSYQPTYLKTRLGMTETQGQIVILIGEIAMMAFLPFCGALSDRVGRKPMWWFSLTGLLVLALPMYWLMGQGLVWAIIGFAVLGLLYIPQLSTITATFPCMFPTQVRYAGFAISYNLSTAAFGGTAPLVNDLMVDKTGWDLFPATYLMLACVVGLCALPFLIETAGASIAGTDIPCVDSHGAEPAEPDEVVRA